MSMNRNVLRLPSAVALSASLAVVACTSDDRTGNQPEAGVGREAGAGGAKGGGGQAPTDGGSGAAGSGGASGASGGNGGGKDAGSGGASKAGASAADAGTPMHDGGAPDANLDGSKTPACGAPADAGAAKLCLTWDPEPITATADPRLDLKGTLIVQAFDTDDPSPTTVPLFNTMYPPLQGGQPQDADLATLPEIDVDGLPETVYLRVLFVDNKMWFANQATLTYGMFVGGFDLNFGVFPPPKLRPVTLTAGAGTSLSVNLTALREFTTKVSLMDGLSLPSPLDGQGPISVGAFSNPAPSMLPVLGGVQIPCTDLTKGPVDAVGFLYSTPDTKAAAGGDDFWLVGQLDDLNQGGLSKPGSIVSLGAGANHLLAPDTQKAHLADGQYSVTVDMVTLNVVISGYQGLAAYACPTN